MAEGTSGDELTLPELAGREKLRIDDYNLLLSNYVILKTTIVDLMQRENNRISWGSVIVMEVLSVPSKIRHRPLLIVHTTCVLKPCLSLRERKKLMMIIYYYY